MQAYHYYTGMGYWPISTRDAVMDMYAQYHTLGGNGTVAHLMKALEDLPIDKMEG